MDRASLSGPISTAVAGVVLVVVGILVNELFPRLEELGGFLNTVGFVLIGVAVIWAVVVVLFGLGNRLNR